MTGLPNSPLLPSTGDSSLRIVVIKPCDSASLVLPIRFIHNRIVLKRRVMQWLEIIPPATSQDAPAQHNTYSRLSTGYVQLARLARTLWWLPVMSCISVSTKRDGIRFLLEVEKEYSQTIQKTITSYIPDAANMRSKYPLNTSRPSAFLRPNTMCSRSRQLHRSSSTTHCQHYWRYDETWGWYMITMQLIVTPLKLKGSPSALTTDSS